MSALQDVTLSDTITGKRKGTKVFLFPKKVKAWASYMLYYAFNPLPDKKKLNQVEGTKIVSESLMFYVANELFVNVLCKETL